MTGRGQEVKFGPFKGGLRDSSGMGENIKDDELFALDNLEVDLDGSLVNRPAIGTLPITNISGVLQGITVLGKFLPDSGANFIAVYIPATNRVRLVDVATGIGNGDASATVTASCVVQYNDKLWVIPSNNGTGTGGYFQISSGLVTFTSVAAIPKGETAVLYKDRLFIGCGIQATLNSSRFRFSSVADPTLWPAENFVDVAPGNGQKLVEMMVQGENILIFKEHSTWNFGYTSDPAKADLVEIDSTIGVPAVNCTVNYHNNIAYVLHDNSVYELFNGGYTRISDNVAMKQTLDPDIGSGDQFGLTLFRDRLFLRYFSKLYVYNLKTKTWCSWVTENKFSKLVVIQNATTGLDTAYAHSVTSSQPGVVFFFQDDRTTGVGSVETFTCSFTTKIFDLDLPHEVKTMFWGGLQAATSGVLTCSLQIPNAGQNSSWLFEEQNFIWSDPGVWDEQDKVLYTNPVAPALGEYARKFIRAYHKKMKFRQLFFTVSTPAIKPIVLSDSSVKIFEMVIVVREGQVVPKETN